jgi:putative aldouronate transport system substrate-binding protein
MFETRFTKKISIFLSLIILVTTVLVGCASNENATSEEQEPTASEQSTDSAEEAPAEPAEPTKISMMNIFFEAEPLKADNPGIQAIEEFTNTELDITWVPQISYAEKVNATIASGQLPQVLMIFDDKAPATINAIRSGMFWEIGPFLKDYPNLSKIDSAVLNNVSVDGKVYGIGRYRPLARFGLIIRKDWLDQLGLSEPRTFEEIYDVAYKFTYNDPDKNGKNDTYGVVLDNNYFMLKQYMVNFAGVNAWGEKEGKLIPDFMFPEYLDALKLHKKMFDEKLVTPDFALNKPSVQYQNEQIVQGKVGMAFFVLNAMSTFASLYENNPSAKLDIIQPISGPLGEKVFPEPGYKGQFFFPKSSIKKEEELKAILSFFDKLGEVEMQNVIDWGIEGVHYSLENGIAVRSAEQEIKFKEEIFPLEQIPWDGRFDAHSGKDPFIIKFKELSKANVDKIVTNPTYPLISQTAIEKGKQLQQNISDAATKFIIGQLDEAGWNKVIEDWKSNGGNQIIEEFTTEYNKIK